ncbi:uncharacterized protein LOC106011374 [Aplysia californica]|uniref:Uncharacterized protein LOC106011374 n=1 Tax=Aplysia californica TaxID=6500 RepID=A0ABM0ZWY4_APLCA|nr:uncharacterized protein LOC106011374 [Aplysia californica]
MDFRRSLRQVREYNMEPTEEGSGGGAKHLLVGASVCTLALFALFCPVVFALGIAKLVMGGLYLHDCELEPMVPIYLLVEGSAGFFLSCNSCGSNDESGQLKMGFCVIFRLLQAAFQIAWLIAGTVWVTSVRSIIYAADFCKTDMSTTVLTTAATTTAQLLTTTQSALTTTVNASIATTTGNSSVILKALSLTLESVPEVVKCMTCKESLVDFTFGVVIFQWVLSGMLLIGIMCCCCARRQ